MSIVIKDSVFANVVIWPYWGRRTRNHSWPLTDYSGSATGLGHDAGMHMPDCRGELTTKVTMPGQTFLRHRHFDIVGKYDVQFSLSKYSCPVCLGKFP
jgi:hypothetical protein